MLLKYHLRSLFVRGWSSLLSIFGIAATVATLAGVLALQQGFKSLFVDSGDPSVAVVLRTGASAEGNSVLTRAATDQIIKGSSEISLGADGQPLASKECFLAVRRRKLSGGETNVPLRGVQPATYAIRGESLRLVEGRLPTPGSDEVLVGERASERIQDCRLGDVLQINVTPFRVVGVFESDGPFDSEIWGDFERLLETLQLPGASRVILKVDEASKIDALAARLEDDKQSPAKVLSEPDYLSSQTEIIGNLLIGLAAFLGLIMGTAAVFTATGTMLSAIAARTSEIGILLAGGFRPVRLFLSFLFESLVIGVIGGALGCLLILPINGIKTGTTNWSTFTEVAFSFRVTPQVLGTAVSFSLLLGLLGGAYPAWRASRMRPAEAIRRG